METGLQRRCGSAISARTGRHATCRVSATLMAKPPSVTLSGHTAKVATPATASDEERVASGAQAGPSLNLTHLQQRPRRSQPVTVAMLNDVRTMFHSLLNEFAYFIDSSWVTGTIPPELSGTYYRNGPGLQVSNPRYRRHTLDGDGMVFSLAFKEGLAFFRNRFVRTEGFKAEQKAGRPLFRNSFTRGAVDGSVNFNPFDLNFKNVANTGVLPWGGQLYALWEAGLPYLMDPVTLDTVRETRMGGQIRTNTFAAHYRIVTEHRQQAQPQHPSSRSSSGTGAGAHAGGSTSTSKRLVTFSNEFGFTGAKAVFYEFDEAGKLIHETDHALQGVDVALIHDMVVTEHYYVLICGPIALHPVKFATQYMLGRCSIAECLVFDRKKPTRIMMFPRPGRPSGKVLAPRVVESPDPFFVFHNVNGYEAEDGQVLVMDVVAWDEVSFEMDLYDKDAKSTKCFEGGSRTQLTRLTVDLRAPGGPRVERRRLLQRTVEFPATDPRVTSRPHGVAWYIADAVDDPFLWGPAQSIVRVQLDPELTVRPSRGAASSSSSSGARVPRTPGLAPPRAAPCAAAGTAAGAAPGVAVDEWFLGDRTFPGEPMFVPRPGSDVEGDGWLIVGVHNADTEKGDVHIFDAQSLSSGPLATIHLPHRLPVSLHGAWHGEYTGPDPHDPAVPRWQHLGSVRPM